jgi:galacturonosyltransferase
MTNNNKILILANNAGGLCSFRIELLVRLIKEGFDVVVSVPNEDRIKDIEAVGARVVPMEIQRRGTNPLKDLQLLFRYRKLIRREKPNVILSYTIKPNVYGGLAACLARVPYIVNITGLGSAVENPGLLQKITVAMYRIAMKRVACIFFQNKGNEQFFASRNIRNEVHRIIPGSGVNLDKFTYREYPAEGDPLRFIFISRIMREKGIEEYFAAAKHFKALYPDMEFHILGGCEEEYEERLAELQREGVIVYHGKQKDVRPFIAMSNCTIHPTFYPEGMSNVILESAATGRPVITTRRHGCMEAIEEGVTGFLFQERSTEELISCIERFIALPYSEKVAMGRAAGVKMEREFSRQIVVDAYLDEIKKCL